MYVLLWNHATQHLTSKDYRASVNFYSAALGYADNKMKGPIAHQLAQAHLALQDLNRLAHPGPVAWVATKGCHCIGGQCTICILNVLRRLLRLASNFS